MSSAPEIINAKAVPLTREGLVPPESFPGFGSRLHRVFFRFRTKIGTFLALSLLAFLLPSAAMVTGFFMSSAAIAVFLDNWRLWALAGAIVITATTVIFMASQAAIGAAAAFKITLGRAFGVGISRSVWYLLTSLLAALYLLPVSLLLLPGIVSGPRLALTLPVLLTEKRKLFAGMNRSRDLVQGHTIRLTLELLALNLILPICVSVSVAASRAASSVLRDMLISAGLTAAANFAVWLLPALTSLLLGLLILPVNVIFMQIFYEDCVREKGWDWEATTWRIRTYQALAVIGALILIGIPVVMGKLVLDDMSRSSLDAVEAPTVTTTVPATTAAAPKVPPTPAPPAVPAAAPAANDNDLTRYENLSLMRIGLSGYLSDHKSYPKSLSSLVPKYLLKMPLDPATNQPFKYETVGNDYRISFMIDEGVFALKPGKHTLTSGGFDVEVTQDQAAPQQPSDTEAPTELLIVPAAPPATTAGLFDEPTEPPAEPPATIEGEAPTETPATMADETTPPSEPVDTDSDGLTDELEAYYGTDPNDPDTDNDGYADGAEVNSGYNPNGPGKL